MSRSFERDKRLLTPRQFKAVFDSPSGKVPGRQLLLLARDNELEHPRLGLVIGKKNVRLAVERNRVKRLIRESFRLHQDDIGSWDIVIIARKGLAEQSSTELRKQLRRFWKRLARPIEAPPVVTPEVDARHVQH